MDATFKIKILKAVSMATLAVTGLTAPLTCYAMGATEDMLGATWRLAPFLCGGGMFGIGAIDDR